MAVPLVRQRDDWDCGVAALAMVLDLPYDTVADTIAREPGTRREGLYVADLLAIATALGRTLRTVGAAEGRIAISFDQPAILGVVIEGDLGCGHWAVLYRGTVLCPRGAVTPLTEYLTTHRAEPFALLVAA